MANKQADRSDVITKWRVFLVIFAIVLITLGVISLYDVGKYLVNKIEAAFVPSAPQGILSDNPLNLMPQATEPPQSNYNLVIVGQSANPGCTDYLGDKVACVNP